MILYYGRLTDPRGNVQEVVATNECEVIHLEVEDEDGDEECFESDFYHAAEWADEMGCQWEQHEFEVTLEKMYEHFGPTPPGPPPSGDWISVEDRMPEPTQYGTSVIAAYETLGGLCRVVGLFYTSNPDAKSEKSRRPRWERNGRIFDHAVSHWMPLPKHPTETI